MQVEQRLKSEGLRCLGAVQPVTRHCCADLAIHRPFQSVRDRRGRDCAGRIGQRSQKRRDCASRNIRPRGIVDQHDVRRMGNQSLQSQAHAVLPGRATGDDRQILEPGQRSAQRHGVAHRL